MPFNKVFEKYEINTINRIAMFIGQVSHESAGLATVEENLNYSGDRLLQVWPSHFRGVNINDYSHKPEAIANRVYADRMGNGDEDSGDGWKFHGRGGIQLTGRSNYQRFADDFGMKIEDVAAYALTPEGILMTAGWFWDDNDLNSYADKLDDIGATKRINGGTNGLAERIQYRKAAMDIFK